MRTETTDHLAKSARKLRTRRDHLFAPENVKPIALLILSFSVLASPGPAEAAPVLDQSQELFSGSQPFGDANRLTQTVTVGVTGQITRVDVLATKRADSQQVVITAMNTTAGIPDTSSVVGSKTITLPSSGCFNCGFTWYELDVSDLDWQVQAGDVVAFEMSRSGSGFFYSWAASFVDPYPGGLHFNTTSEPPAADPGRDDAFRTFVEPGIAVPAISVGGVTMLAVALVLLLTAVLTRRRESA